MLGGPVHGLEVYPLQFVPFLFAGLVQWPRWTHDPSVIVDRVETAKLLENGCNGRAYRAAIGYIHLKGYAVVASLFSRDLGLIEIAIQHCNGGAVSSVRQSTLTPNAGSASGQEYDFILEPICHGVTNSSVLLRRNEPLIFSRSAQ